MLNQLDHIIIAAPDLEIARAWFEDLTGVMPEEGGSHPGLATRNALVSFGRGCYLEIVAPDPAQEIEGSFAEPFTLLDAPTIYHWVVQVDAIEHMRAGLIDRGATVGATKSISRRNTAGDLLSWKMLGVTGHPHGGLLPLYIDWQGCPHPSSSVQYVGNLLQFEVSLSGPHKAVENLLGPVPADVSMRMGDIGISLRFNSPKGVVELKTAGRPTGIEL